MPCGIWDFFEWIRRKIDKTCIGRWLLAMESIYGFLQCKRFPFLGCKLKYYAFDSISLAEQRYHTSPEALFTAFDPKTQFLLSKLNQHSIEVIGQVLHFFLNCIEQRFIVDPEQEILWPLDHTLIENSWCRLFWSRFFSNNCAAASSSLGRDWGLGIDFIKGSIALGLRAKIVVSLSVRTTRRIFRTNFVNQEQTGE